MHNELRVTSSSVVAIRCCWMFHLFQLREDTPESSSKLMELMVQIWWVQIKQKYNVLANYKCDYHDNILNFLFIE